MDTLFWIGFVGAAVAGVFAWVQARKVMRYSEGTERMQKIASSIRQGANAYLKRQYTTVCKVFLVVFVVLLALAFGPRQLDALPVHALCVPDRRRVLHARPASSA